MESSKRACAAVVWCVLVVSLASTAVAAEPQRTQSNFKGNFASGWFESALIDENGMYCGYRYANVYASDQWLRTQPGQPTTFSGADVSFASHNWCTGEFDYGYGFVSGGVSFGRNLSSATASGSFTRQTCTYVCEPVPCELPNEPPPGECVEDFDCGPGALCMDGVCQPFECQSCYEVCEPAGQVTFSVNWTGTGDPYRGMYMSHYRGGEFSSHYRGQGTWRSATLTGTISVDGVPLEFDYGYGDISSTTSGQMEIYRY